MWVKARRARPPKIAKARIVFVDVPGATTQLVVKQQSSFLSEEQLLTRMGNELARAGVTCPTSSAIARELGLED